MSGGRVMPSFVIVPCDLIHVRVLTFLIPVSGSHVIREC